MSESVEDTARAELLQLLRDHAVMHGDFVLSSGKRSTYYIDARLVTLSARGSALVGTLVLAAARGAGAQAVAGLAIGADPVVCAAVTTAGAQRVELDGLIVRKEAKQHGAGRQIEGPWQAGMRVLVVDDTLTTGASAVAAADAIASAGGEVRGIVAVIDREEGAREAIEDRGYRYTPLFRVSELL